MAKQRQVFAVLGPYHWTSMFKFLLPQYCYHFRLSVKDYIFGILIYTNISLKKWSEKPGIEFFLKTRAKKGLGRNNPLHNPNDPP